LAVLDAYDWPYDLTDEEILEWLLALNLEQAFRGGGVVRIVVRDGAGPATVAYSDALW